MSIVKKIEKKPLLNLTLWNIFPKIIFHFLSLVFIFSVQIVLKADKIDRFPPQKLKSEKTS